MLEWVSVGLESCWSTHLCNLHTPVEKVLGADVVLVLSDVVKEAAVRHQLCDELNSRGEADSQQAAHMRIVNTSHHVSFLRRKGKKKATWNTPFGMTAKFRGSVKEVGHSRGCQNTICELCASYHIQNTCISHSVDQVSSAWCKVQILNSEASLRYRRKASLPLLVQQANMRHKILRTKLTDLGRINK